MRQRTDRGQQLPRSVCNYSGDERMMKRIPPILDEVPEAYLKPAAHQGSVETFAYETFEAFSYQKKQRKIQKKALV